MGASRVPFNEVPMDMYDMLAMIGGVYPSYAGIVDIDDFPYTKIEITDEYISEENVYPGEEEEKDALMKIFLTGKD